MCTCVVVYLFLYCRIVSTCMFLGVLFMFLIVGEISTHLTFQVALSSSVLQILPHENSHCI